MCLQRFVYNYIPHVYACNLRLHHLKTPLVIPLPPPWLCQEGSRGFQRFLDTLCEVRVFHWTLSDPPLHIVSCNERMIKKKFCPNSVLSERESLLIQQAHFPQRCCGNWAAEIFSLLVRGIILKRLHLKTLSRKLDKNMNLFLPKQELF